MEELQVKGYWNQRWLRRYRWAVWLCIASLLFNALPVAAQDAPTPAGSAASTLEECATVEEGALADELNLLTQGVLGSALEEIDVAAIVDDKWQELGIDLIVASEVDAAVAQVRADQDLWNTFLSGWNAGLARELSLAVANKAFDSESFRQAVEQLSTAVAEEIGIQVGVLSAEGASSAAYCLQTFISANYAPVLVEAFESEVANAAGAAQIDEADLPSSLLTAIDQHKVALGGVGVIIATQIAKRLVVRLSQQVAQRVAGRLTARVLGRLGTTVIPLAGWIIGGGMIAYDIYSGRDGALPEIQEQLKSEEIAASIRAEIAAVIIPELRTEIPGVARELANGLYGQWSDVRADLRVILELAGESEAYAELLGQVENEAALQDFVALNRALLGIVGRAGVLAAADSGDLVRALPLGETLAPVVAATGSLETALDWADSAGDLLDDVVALEIYKIKQPNELTRAELQRLIALDNPTIIAKVGLLPVDQLRALLGLSTATLKQLGESMLSENLAWVAQAIQGRSQEDVNALVSLLASDPQLVNTIQEKSLLEALPPTANIPSAVGFVAGPTDPMAIINDTVEVVAGEPTWSLFRLKYGWGVTLLTIVVLILLALIVLRLIWALGAWLLRPITVITGGGK